MSRSHGLSLWGAIVSTIAVAACGGPSTSSNGGGGEAGDGGGSPSTVDNRPSDVSVPEAPIDFGLADCGGAAPAEKAVKITNAGGSTVSWTAELEADGFTIVGTTSGSFSGGGSVNVKVKANAIPASAAAAAESRATLIVVIDKMKVFRIPLRVTAQGATLAVMPGEAVFGEMPINVQAPDVPLTIKNTGNKAVSISLVDPALTDFKIKYTGSPAAVSLAPGATLPGAAARFRPSKLTLQSTSAPMTVKGAVCGASATSVAMSGKGSGGVVGVSPGQLDFGKVNCGGSAPFQVFTILNSGNAAFNWSAVLKNGAGSSFDLSPTSGIVLAGSQAQVFVTPKSIPQTSAITANLYGDVLTVTTDAANDMPHDVTLLMTAKGAILAYTATPADYGVRGLFSAALGKTASIANTGNATATVKLASTTTAYTSVPAGNTAILAGSALNATINFVPTGFGDNNADLSFTTSDVLCQPLPASAPLTGQGKGIATSVGVGAKGRPGRAASTCAVLTGGHVACWGDNTYGQLGIGSTSMTPQATPIVIPAFSGAVAVAGGGEHNCAQMANGTVYCWGRNATNRGGGGQLGTAGADKSVPTLVAGLSNVISLSAAHRHTCAVSTAAAGGTNGKVYCWGINGAGQLGSGNIGTDTSVPTATSILDAVSVSTTSEGGCARRIGNTVKCWGRNNEKGQLGTGTTTDNAAATPGVDVVGVAGGTLAAVALGAGGGGGGNRHSGLSCAVRMTTNDVVCWGDNRHGKIRGVDTGVSPASEPTPVIITNVAGATAVATGRQHACAIVAGGAVKCWGRGGQGQLGNGTTPDPSGAVSVTGLANVTQLSASGGSTCALLNTGSISCWGVNESQGTSLGNPAAGGPNPTVVSGF